MRITDRGVLDDALRSIQRAQERLQTTHRRSTSGVQVDRPSDDTVAYSEISAQEEILTRLLGYNRNIATVRAKLSATENTLQSLQGVLNRLRELHMMAFNDAIYTPAIAEEAEHLYNELLTLVNQSFGGEHLFSGYGAGPPFNGARFVGDNQKRAVEISPLGATVFGVSAQEAFGVTPGQDVFKDIKDAVAAMRARNQAGIGAGLDAIDRHFNLLTRAIGSLGAQMNTLSVAERANEEYALELQKSLSRQRDIDPAQVYSQLAADRYALEATFAVLGTSSRMSLLKYL